jgi:XFP C-terminal domain/Phosphoglucomutase/phosphomannomutase, alpha/beta/alpha domain I
MKVSPWAGKPAEASMLVNVTRLVTAYYTEVPDASVPEQRVAFGTSGHRGSAFEEAFNEWHVLAISQAICLWREQNRIDGPLFLVMDTIDRLPQTGDKGICLKQQLKGKLIEHKQYIDKHGQDMPKIRNWKWSPSRIIRQGRTDATLIEAS